MKQQTPKPTHCGECIFFDSREKDNYIAPCIFDGDSAGFCLQSNMKCYRDEDPCPWGILKNTINKS
jgi:hypothetical protein